MTEYNQLYRLFRDYLPNVLKVFRFKVGSGDDSPGTG
jgi:hypothetical protein